ncbi:MAG: hypothetical protein ACLSFZ_00530 [Frisingicoccus sp.]
MLIEQKSIEELQDIIKQKGFFSKEAEVICLEIEYSKKQYEQMIQHPKAMYGWYKEAESVVKYYLSQMEQLKYDLPYDAMGCQVTVPILILNEFQKDNITERIIEYIDEGREMDAEKIRREVQRFITAQLDPRGVVLYMDILEHREAAEKYKTCHI